jgi:hypothetical protein
MRVLMLTVAVLAVACSPPAPATNEETASTEGQAGQTAEAPDAERDAMVDALSSQAGVEIGLPVTFQVTTKRVEGEWGWLVAQPWTREGAQIDWSTTRYAQRAADGVLDGGGTTYALLRRQNGTWSVVAFAVGPTDVAYADWPQRFGAPASIMTAN